MFFLHPQHYEENGPIVEILTLIKMLKYIRERDMHFQLVLQC